jgi:hypothetical protein
VYFEKRSILTNSPISTRSSSSHPTSPDSIQDHLFEP